MTIQLGGGRLPPLVTSKRVARNLQGGGVGVGGWKQHQTTSGGLRKGGALCKLNGGALFFTHYFNMFYLHLQLSATMHFIKKQDQKTNAIAALIKLNVCS